MNKNEKYTILSIRGLIDYIEDFDSGIIKRDEVVGELTKMFPNAQKNEFAIKHSVDPSGNSIVDGVELVFDSRDKAQVHCSNYEETFRIKNKRSEGLSVAIRKVEIRDWLNNHN